MTPFEAGKVYDYKFDINEIRGPIILTVEEREGSGFQSPRRGMPPTSVAET